MKPTKIVFTLLLTIYVSGCATAAKLTSDEKSEIEIAENVCGELIPADKNGSLNIVPVVDGIDLEKIVGSMAIPIRGDAAVYLSLISKDLCYIAMISGKAEIRDWTNTLKIPFETWSTLSSIDTTKEQLSILNKSKNDLLENLDEIKEITIDPIPFSIFNEIIPKRNYLIITRFNFDGKLAQKYDEKKLGAHVKGNFGSNNFSVQLRPALQNRRIELAFFSLKKVSSKATVKRLVTDLYDVQAERIQSK